ncbi:MAG: preprotein translocase subunit Sec61beta [Candidatus Micrarchaeota archaeon]
MADDRKISTPSSSTGIIRFYDVKSSNIQVDPRVVIGFVVAFIVLELLLRLRL